MHTLDELIAAGYSIQNAKITSVSLNMEDYGCLTLAMALEGGGWGVVYGGYCLGKGYLGAEEFEGSAKGMEAIMRIMNTVGVSDLLKMKDKYIRVATKGLGSTVKIIGNIINDIWFDYEAFFNENGGVTNEYDRRMEYPALHSQRRNWIFSYLGALFKTPPGKPACWWRTCWAV